MAQSPWRSAPPSWFWLFASPPTGRPSPKKWDLKNACSVSPSSTFSACSRLWSLTNGCSHDPDPRRRGPPPAARPGASDGDPARPVRRPAVRHHHRQDEHQPVTALAQKNARTGAKMALLALAMVALAFASVPLYRIFCQVTGFGGATVRAAEAPGAVAGEIGVRFDANIDPALPWKFEPAERVRVRLGERTIVNYRATNYTARPTTGR